MSEIVENYKRWRRSVSNAIRSERRNSELSLRRAAKMVGTSTATLSRIERGLECNGAQLHAVRVWLARLGWDDVRLLATHRRSKR